MMGEIGWPNVGKRKLKIDHPRARHCTENPEPLPTVRLSRSISDLGREDRNWRVASFIGHDPTSDNG